MLRWFRDLRIGLRLAILIAILAVLVIGVVTIERIKLEEQEKPASSGWSSLPPRSTRPSPRLWRALSAR